MASAHVVVRLMVESREVYLVRINTETDEGALLTGPTDLPGLADGADFVLHSLVADGDAHWYALKFTHDPVECFKKLPADVIVLVDRRAALTEAVGANVTELLRRLEALLPGGLASVPLAWSDPLDRNRVLDRTHVSRATRRSIPV